MHVENEWFILNALTRVYEATSDTHTFEDGEIKIVLKKENFPDTGA